MDIVVQQLAVVLHKMMMIFDQGTCSTSKIKKKKNVLHQFRVEYEDEKYVELKLPLSSRV